MAQGFFFNDEMQTPEALDRRRALINALAKENLSTAPVQHWTQALARVLGAGADQYETAKLNDTERKSVEENKAALLAAFGSGGGASPTAPSAGAALPASQPAPATPPVPRETPPGFAEDGTPMPPVRPSGLGIVPADAPLANRQLMAGASPVLPTASFQPPQQAQAAPSVPAPAAPPANRAMAFAPIGPANSPMPSLVRSESGGNWQAQNNAMGAGGMPGHFGRLQFGQARLQQAIAAGALPPGTTPQSFMASPDLQRRAEQWHFADIDRAIANGPGASAIGRTINGIPITQDGLRAVAHLGGVGGMNRFVQTNGAYNPADANGTSLMAYAQMHGGQGGAAPAGASSAPQAAPGATQRSGVNPALLAALSSPWAARNPMLAQLGMKVAGDQMAGRQTTPVDLGNQIALLDKSGQIVGYLPKAKDATDEALKRVQLQAAQRDLNESKPFEITIDGEKVTVQRDAQGNLKRVQLTGEPDTQAPKMFRMPDGREVPLPKDPKAREAFVKEMGTAGAKAVEGAPNAVQTAMVSLGVIDQLIGTPDGRGKEHPGLKNLFGMYGKLPTMPGSETANAEALLTQIKDRSFLQGIESMRGTGAITEAEGAKATGAIARLNTNQSPAAFKQSLQELRTILQTAAARNQTISNNGAPPPRQAPAPAPAPAPAGEPVTINGFTIQRVQ